MYSLKNQNLNKYESSSFRISSYTMIKNSNTGKDAVLELKL